MEYNGEITEINPGTWVFFVNEISTAETFGDLSPRITPGFLLGIRAVIQLFSPPYTSIEYIYQSIFYIEKGYISTPPSVYQNMVRCMWAIEFLLLTSRQGTR